MYSLSKKKLMLFIDMYIFVCVCVLCACVCAHVDRFQTFKNGCLWEIHIGGGEMRLSLFYICVWYWFLYYVLLL